MNALDVLIPLSFFFSLVGLAGFIWAARSGQFNDLTRDQYTLDLDPPAKKECK